MRVNIFGIIVVALGLVCIFLGVTGRYQAFVGAQGTSTSNSSSNSSNSSGSSGTETLPTQGNVVAD